MNVNAVRLLAYQCVGFVILAGSALGTAWAQGTRDDFERSRSYVQRTRNLVFRDTVDPQWIGESNTRFWYRVTTGPRSHQFVLVEADTGTRRLAMDHDRLAQALSKATKAKVEATRLQLQSLTFSPDVSRCRFRFGGKAWTFELPAGPLLAVDDTAAEASARIGLPAERRVARSGRSDRPATIRFENQFDRPLRYFWVMPDGNLRLYGTVAAGKTRQVESYDGHAWLLKDDSGNSIASFVASSSQELAVINDETLRPEPLGGRQRRGGRATSPDGNWRVIFDSDNVVLIDTSDSSRNRLTNDGRAEDSYGGPVWWSPDSAHFAVMKTKPGMRRTIPIVESSPKDSLHSRILTVPYAKPGDPVDHPRPILFSRADNWVPKAINDAMFPHPFDLRDLAWHSGSKSFSFLYNERGHQRLRLIRVDTQTAKPSITIDETSDTFICYSSKTYLHRIDASDELIWMSERSGWNHLYLIDALTGEVKNPITSGQWLVRGVERVDDLQRQIYLKVSGIDPKQDPYQVHLIRIGFDGKNLVRLTTGDGNHRWQFSPDDRYLIDTYSRVDLPAVTELRDAETGGLICELEQADASALLETLWRPPERFVAKGRDGRANIHGIIVRPTDFDPK